MRNFNYIRLCKCACTHQLYNSVSLWSSGWEVFSNAVFRHRRWLCLGILCNQWRTTCFFSGLFRNRL